MYENKLLPWSYFWEQGSETVLFSKNINYTTMCEQLWLSAILSIDIIKYYSELQGALKVFYIAHINFSAHSRDHFILHST